MKKIFYILASAIVALGAVACENEGLDNIAPEGKGETLSFTAEIDNTRIALNGLQTVWAKGDELVIKGYTFVCQNDGKTFIGEGEGINAAFRNDEELTVWYNENLDSTKGLNGVSMKGVGKIVSGGEAKLTFSLQCALLKYTTTEEVDFEGTALSAGFKVTGDGTTQYIAINTGDNLTLSYSVGGVQCKSLEKNFVAGNIYNLGDLAAPVGLCYKGSWDNWTNLRGMFLEGDYYVAKNVVCPANTTFKFVIKSSGVMMGATSATTSLGTWNAFANNDIKIATAGTYNIYVSKNSGAWCVVKSTTSVPALNNKKYLYLIPSSGWKSDGAKFGAWCYGGTAAGTNKNFTWAMWEGNNDYYYMDVTGHKQFYIKRLSSDGNSTWNEVGPITIGNNTLVTITGWNASSFKATSLIP